MVSKGAWGKAAPRLQAGLCLVRGRAEPKDQWAHHDSLARMLFCATKHTSPSGTSRSAAAGRHDNVRGWSDAVARCAQNQCGAPAPRSHTSGRWASREA